MTPVIILGAGGHARVLIDALQMTGCRIVGIIDPAFAVGSSGPAGLPILGGNEALDGYSPNDVELVNGIGSIGSLALRDTVYRRGKEAGFRFAQVVHRSAVIGGATDIGEGVQIMAGCVIQYGSSIGANSIINTRASVDHDCQIGQSVHVAPGVTLSGGVRIGDRAHIGTGAAVIQGVSIGSDSLVGAGAAVYRDIPAAGRLIRGQ
ncbi:acetyltransferase [Tardiphaga sp. 866_E4_N2_1]|uniref:acetyltransferase n=1 Tax=unclassified Tardiphaga TaxID=2631404 RepID=UPI003F26D683